MKQAGNACTFSTKTCQPCEGGVPPLTSEQISAMLEKIPEWGVEESRKKIYRIFKFDDFYQTMAFVNAIAWLAHQENHHPHIEIGYDNCVVQYWTHAIDGISENDFICASKVNQLYERS